MKEVICIVCPRGCRLRVDEENGYAVSGNACPRGAEYGKMELQNPVRTVTTTVCCAGGLYPRCPVRTNRPIPKGLVIDAVAALNGIVLTAPIRQGQTVLQNVCGTGADFVTERDL